MRLQELTDDVFPARKEDRMTPAVFVTWWHEAMNTEVTDLGFDVTIFVEPDPLPVNAVIAFQKKFPSKLSLFKCSSSSVCNNYFLFPQMICRFLDLKNCNFENQSLLHTSAEDLRRVCLSSPQMKWTLGLCKAVRGFYRQGSSLRIISWQRMCLSQFSSSPVKEIFVNKKFPSKQFGFFW